MPDGSIRDCSSGEPGPILPPETPVSMNMWGYHPDILPKMEKELGNFLRALSPEDNRSECLLPVVMDRFLAEGVTRTAVLHTDDRWFGLTYREDKPGVTAALQALRDASVYPPALWG